MDLVRSFLDATKYSRDRLPEARCGVTRVPPYKRYDETLPRITLPRPESLPKVSFWETVARRRSLRRYTQAEIPGVQLCLLLWATQGITRPGNVALRSSPSAGALFPIETYVAVNRVADLEPGLYHWELPDERLVLLRRDENLGESVASACLDQSMCRDAACNFLWTAVFERTLWKYGDRGLRYVYLDAGHMGHALQMAATALGLGSCNIGALFDDEVNRLLGVDGTQESIVYAASVGAAEGPLGAM
ncbi:MAG: SagB/ThcOx family dehydrogenase [Planctomycetes bacterium]|nr:SagB/ThcOx family dehydrogenase [Planctomycetota bacterium]